MGFTKLPTKAEGTKFVLDGNPITCIKTGEYQGKPQLSWRYDETGTPVFRKINGTITQVGPTDEVSKTETSKEQTVCFPELNSSFAEAHAPELESEANWFAMAVKVVHQRNPDLKENSATFGMIVNATCARLLAQCPVRK